MINKVVAIFGGIAVLLITVLAVGLLLPNSWEAEQTVEMESSAVEVFSLVADLARWDDWTVWSEFESVVSIPSEGVGATRTWDDPTYGAGRIEIKEVVAPSLLRYRVELEGGRAWVEGEITLTQRASGTAVTWKESGHFGWNPLMGYMARRMPASQTAQMLESLGRLSEATAPATDTSAAAGGG